MDRVVYIIFSKNKDVFNMIYVAESDKTEARDFFIKNDQFKCWMSYAGKEENLYLSIYPMWESSQPERNQLIKKIIARRYLYAQKVKDQGMFHSMKCVTWMNHVVW